MTKPLIVEAEAEEELEDAVLWYEDQRPGLGRQLLDAVNTALAGIRRFPRAGARIPHVPPDLAARRAPVDGFPYHLAYIETERTIHVVAVAHDRRRPGYWLRRWPR